MLGRLRAVQLDTISVLARSHELVTFARLGPIGRARIDEGYWGPASATFEYWSHAACILPLEDWPAYGFQAPGCYRPGPSLAPPRGRGQELLVCPRPPPGRGPLSARELGGAKKGGPWWDWSETKIAAEWLSTSASSSAASARASSASTTSPSAPIPAELLGIELSDEDCQMRLIEAAAGALGVATAGDLAAYHGLDATAGRTMLARTALLPAKVEGWDQPAFTSRRRARGARAAHEGPRRCSSLLSTPSPGTGSGPNGSSASATASRLMCPGPSGCTATSRCRSSAATASSASWTPAAAATPLSPSMSPSKPKTPPPMSPRHWFRAAAWVDSDNIVVERVTPAERTSELCGLVAAAQS